MTQIEALNIAINLLNDYMSGSPDADEQFEEAEEVLNKMRNNLQIQQLKKKLRKEPL